MTQFKVHNCYPQATDLHLRNSHLRIWKKNSDTWHYQCILRPMTNFPLQLSRVISWSPQILKTMQLTPGTQHWLKTWSTMLKFFRRTLVADVPPVIKFLLVASWNMEVCMGVRASLQLFPGFLLGFLHLWIAFGVWMANSFSQRPDEFPEGGGL